jgi:hypothetical protein
MDIRQLLRERLAAFDLALDTAEGSPVDNDVIEPIARLFDQDPLSTDVRTFIEAKFADAFPGMVVARGDALSDVLISAVDVFFAAYRQHLSYLSGTRSIANIAQLTADDADALAANWYVQRSSGTYASGTVRVVFSSARPLTVTEDVTFSTLGGQAFTPLAAVSVTSDQLLSNMLGQGRYAVDVPVISTTPGAAGNIAAHTVRLQTGLINVLSVDNDSAFVGGGDGDTTEGLLRTKIPRAISERSLVTSRGIAARVASDVSNVANIQVIGMHDAEMERDIVQPEAFSLITGMGIALVFADSVLLQYFATPTAPPTVGSGIKLTRPDTTYGAKIERILFETDSVVLNAGNLTGGGAVFCRASGTDEATGFYFFSTYAAQGSIINGIPISGPLHLGGRTDVYVRPTSDSSASVSYSLSHDTDTSYYGTDHSVVEDQLNVVQLTHLPDVARRIQPRDMLRIEEQSATILRAVYVSDQRTDVICDTNFDANSGGAWSTARYMAADLAQREVRIYPRTGLPEFTLSGSIGSSIVTLQGASATQLSAAGVRADDKLIVDGVSGALVVTRYEGVDIHINAPLVGSIPPSRARIVRALSGTTYAPATHVKSCALGDEPVPYALPLGIKLGALSPGRPPYIADEGYVAPSLQYALRGPTDPRYGRLLDDVNIRQYRIQDAAVIDPQNNDTLDLGFTHARRAPRAGTQVYAFYSESDATFGQARGTHFIELELWNELLVTGTRNIFVHVVTSDSSLAARPLPRSGDVLSIPRGGNAGDYLIDDVITHDFSAQNTRLGRTSLVRVSGQSITRVSLIKIFGEFPEPVPDYFCRTIRPLSAFSDSGDRPSALSLDELLHALCGQGFTASPVMDAHVGVTDIGVAVDFEPSASLRYMFAARPAVFSVAPARRAEARVVRSAADVLQGARAPISTNISLSTATQQLLYARQLPFAPYKIAKHSQLMWGTSLLVIDPTRLPVLTGGDDPTSWPSDGLKLIPNNVFANAQMYDDEQIAASADCVHVPALARTSEAAQTHSTLLICEERMTVDDATTPKLTPFMLQDERGTFLIWMPCASDVADGPVTLSEEYACYLTTPTEALYTGAGDGPVRSPTQTRLFGMARDNAIAVIAAGSFTLTRDSNPVQITSFGAAQLLYTRALSGDGSPLLTVGQTVGGDTRVRMVPPTLGRAFNAFESDQVVARIDWDDGLPPQQCMALSLSADGTLLLSEPARTSSQAILAHGMAVIADGAIKVGDVPSLAAVDNPPLLLYPRTLLNNGGASRPFLQSDVDKYITLWSCLIPSSGQIVPTVRKHLGTFKITAVESALVTNLGTEYVHGQVVEFDATWDTDDAMIDERVYYVVTAKESAPVATVQFFDAVPKSFPLVGYSTAPNHAHTFFALARRGEPTAPSTLNMCTALSSTTWDRNNLYNVRAVAVTDVMHVVALRSPQSVDYETCYVTETWGEGFLVDAGDRLCTRSTDESHRLLLPLAYYPAASNSDTQLGVELSYTDVVGRTQALVDRESERVVCSDTLARRMNVAYVGLRMTYVGGPTEQQLVARLRLTIENSIRQGVSFGESDIANIAYAMGATRVSLPVELYLCLEDLSRVRHRREVRNVLDASRFLHVDGTYRTFSLAVAPAEITDTALGASIIVTRLESADRLIGSGGA